LRKELPIITVVKSNDDPELGFAYETVDCLDKQRESSRTRPTMMGGRTEQSDNRLENSPYTGSLREVQA
jgi:hypothetical protein